ncbi:hypothetical protein WOLCODRAFT_161681 [Wolfiporia cocos MD-104 SS10]|uniref:Transmembrane protein n=1 Tax=Wolfiporia cocos (strain MD-104) TaxID=742152 RepID=A0A2H3JFJ2_WOLCO|nr:hypothetical protein WOLCODRAFT_161681 [Wolfiporia cocos MD-104 SS10]
MSPALFLDHNIDGGIILPRASPADVSPSDPSIVTETKVADSGIPEIGGSRGGFIALVVILATIFVSCCVAVFFLLRDHNPTPYERELRRARRLQRRETGSYEVPGGRPGLKGRLARLFGRRQAEGWVRAGDGDEWDAADEPVRPAAGDVREYSRPESFTFVGGSVGTAGLPRVDQDMSSESVELSVPEPALDTSYASVGRDLYTDPFTSSPTSLERTETQNSDESTGPSHGHHTRDDSHFTVRTGMSDSVSVRSMQKFESGTKFKEALDF